MQRIIPSIWCTGNAEEMAAAYTSIFENSSAEVELRYPDSDLPEFQRAFAGLPVTVALTVSGTRFILINSDDTFHPNPSISFMLNFDPLLFDGSEELARASLDRIWDALGEGGSVLMPLGEYPFSAHYGWVQDRFGVSWQLMLTDPAGDPRPFVIPALMFDGPSQNRAAEAADFYVSLFEDAAVGNRSPYREPTGNASAEALAFGEFRVGDQWFMASDNGSGIDFGFTPGVSLIALCDDQAEIDRLWGALSTVPEAEACGWCTDRFGVSWQVVPVHQNELMRRPGAYQRMLEMKKLVIADF